MRLYQRTFPPVIGNAATSVTSEMAQALTDLQHANKVARDTDGDGLHAGVEGENDGTAEKGVSKLAMLLKFRARYQGLIEPLRHLQPANLDVLAMIAHYDDWIVHLTDLVAETKDADKLLETERVKAVSEIAVDSGRALRDFLIDFPGAPSVDLYHFQRLTNEIQSLCAAVGSRAKNLDDLRDEVAKSNYFVLLDRFLEITEGSRIDEAMHGLIVATMLRDDDEGRMQTYGLAMVRSMLRVLKVAGVEPTETHPVMTLSAPLLAGEPPLDGIPQLSYYIRNHHPEVVREALANTASREATSSDEDDN
ncbi:hypothetical protein [Rhizobium leguminosarum]|uniref:hypothetical protein n=1 Tax=Rhizobium leguminosarum TaxID=384 RepID=UPI001F4856F6|nr:hypothetical protein [Rhizobium leguminosarum]UIK19386.1 hypothetical protein LZK79_10365 [Rhizobium leguminosarum]